MGLEFESSDSASLKGKTSSDALTGRSHFKSSQIPASSNGRFMSILLQVSRDHIGTSYGKAYFNGKDPVDLTQNRIPIENRVPHYRKASKLFDEVRNFIEPKDTQGGIYRENEPSKPENCKHKSSTRKSHHDPQAVIAGGVAVGE